MDNLYCVECHFLGRQFFRQPPGIAVLLQTMHDIIGNPVTIFFRQLPAHFIRGLFATAARARP
jgi:hypothetical protein